MLTLTHTHIRLRSGGDQDSLERLREFAAKHHLTESVDMLSEEKQLAVFGQMLRAHAKITELEAANASGGGVLRGSAPVPLAASAPVRPCRSAVAAPAAGRSEPGPSGPAPSAGSSTCSRSTTRSSPSTT